MKHRNLPEKKISTTPKFIELKLFIFLSRKYTI